MIIRYSPSYLNTSPVCGEAVSISDRLKSGELAFTVSVTEAVTVGFGLDWTARPGEP